MIYITGDVHGDYDNLLYRLKSLDIKNEDYVIVVGDFGFVWDDTTNTNIRLLATINASILFVDGNHENFSLLNSFPVEDWNGGLIHRVSSNIIHLMRGQFFVIEGKKFWTFGGAYSIDRAYRIKGISYWSQELPSNDEYNVSSKVLEEHNFNVDYILTHTIPERFYYKLHIIPDQREKELLGYLDWVYDRTTFSHWYAGHHHINKTFSGDRLTILYEDIVSADYFSQING